MRGASVAPRFLASAAPGKGDHQLAGNDKPQNFDTVFGKVLTVE